MKETLDQLSHEHWVTVGDVGPVFRQLLLMSSWFACTPGPQQTQNMCITFVQGRPNVFDIGPTLYKCHTNVLCTYGWWLYKWAFWSGSASVHDICYLVLVLLLSSLIMTALIHVVLLSCLAAVLVQARPEDGNGDVERSYDLIQRKLDDVLLEVSYTARRKLYMFGSIFLS